MPNKHSVWLTMGAIALLLGPSAAARAAAPPNPALLRAQQMLAHLGYLPISWKASPPEPGRPLAIDWLKPPPGIWSWTRAPQILRRFWGPPGFPNLLTRGALMRFQAVSGLPVSGMLTPATESALDRAWTLGRLNPGGYNYALVDEYQGTTRPEALTLWHNGAVVLETPVNTGIAQTPTPLGTFPVYLRYRSQTMAGVTPWGTPYDDPGVPYVNYIDGGVAVHGFVRAGYGYPQSLGCIELPIPEAAIAWQYLGRGTLVTVVANVAPALREVMPRGSAPTV